MTLQNVFGDLALEATLQDILTEVTAIAGVRRIESNTTSVPLTSVNQTFTGDWFDASEIGVVSFFAFTDQPFTAARLEWSDDGITPNSGSFLGTTNYLTSEELTSGYYVYYPDPQPYIVAPFARLALEKTSGTDQTVLESYMWSFPVGANPFTFTDASGALSTLSKAMLVRSISPPVEVAFWTDEDDGTIPSGGAVTIDPVLNAEANVLDSGWVDVQLYDGTNLINAQTDVAVSLYLMNATDDQGANIFGDGAPVLNTVAGFPAQLQAIFPQRYFRVVAVNTSGSSLTNYAIRDAAMPSTTDGITTAIGQPVFDFYPAKIGRSVVMGRQPDGDYVNTPATGLAADVNGVAVHTETPLGASLPYQTGWVDTDGWDEIEVTIAADVTSASGGIVLEFTSDANATTPVANAGTTARTFGAADVAAGSLTFRVPPRADGCRLTYTNGGSAQASFLMEMVLRADTTSAPRGPLESDITGTQDSVVGRNALMAPDETSGAWTNIEQADGGLKVSLSTGGGVSIIALDTWTSSRVSVPSDSSVELTGSSPLTDRKTITIKANASNNKEVFIGPNSGVGSSSARIAAGESVTLDLDASASVWAIADAGTLSVSVIEIA